MIHERKVVLIGESLLLDAVEASLEDRPGLAVLRVHCATCDAVACLKSLAPDLVIFDLNTPLAGSMWQVLRDRPGLPLLGVDITSSEALVLNSEIFAVETADTLTEVIQQQTAEALCGRMGVGVELGKLVRAGALAAAAHVA